MAGAFIPIKRPVVIRQPEMIRQAVRPARLIPTPVPPTVIGVTPGSLRAAPVAEWGDFTTPLSPAQSEFVKIVNGSAQSPSSETPPRTFAYYKGRSKTSTRKIPRDAIFKTSDSSYPATVAEVPVLQGGVPPPTLQTMVYGAHPLEFFNPLSITPTGRSLDSATAQVMEDVRARNKFAAWTAKVDEIRDRQSTGRRSITEIDGRPKPVFLLEDLRPEFHRQNVEVAKVRADKAADKISENVGKAVDVAKGVVKKPYTAVKEGVKAGWQKSEETLGHQLAARALSGIWKYYTGNGWWKGFKRVATTVSAGAAATLAYAALRRNKSMEESNRAAAKNIASESGTAGLTFSNHVERISRDLAEYASGGRMSESNGFLSAESYARMMTDFGKAVADVAKYRAIADGGTDAARARAAAAADETYRRQYNMIREVVPPDDIDLANRNLEAAGIGVTPDAFKKTLDGMFLSRGGANGEQ